MGYRKRTAARVTDEHVWGAGVAHGASHSRYSVRVRVRVKG